jgi:hypothetical protein
VEKNVSADRVTFLKQLLEFNKYTVVVAASPPPKAPPAPKPIAASEENSQASSTLQSQPQPQLEPLPPAPETFTIGVTDVTFNPTNAIFGRLLKTPDKHIVTLAYWQQKESVSNDEVPYYEKEKEDY